MGPSFTVNTGACVQFPRSVACQMAVLFTLQFKLCKDFRFLNYISQHIIYLFLVCPFNIFFLSLVKCYCKEYVPVDTLKQLCESE